MKLTLALVPAVILLQTLFFKFTAAPESVFIFTQLGVEPWGRLLSGVIELVAVALILVPVTAEIGAVLIGAIMAGAILSHLLVLGIEVQGDGGLLFILACVALVTACGRVWLGREELMMRWKGRS